MKNVPSALKSVSLIVVRGGVAPSFELSAIAQTTHSNHGLKRNILPPGFPRSHALHKDGFRLQITHGFRGRQRPGEPLEAINVQAGKDFGRKEF